VSIVLLFLFKALTLHEMYRLSIPVLLVSKLVAISAIPAQSNANPYNLTTPVCGPPNRNGNGVCVDYNAITSKPYAQYISDNEHDLSSQVRPRLSFWI